MEVCGLIGVSLGGKGLRTAALGNMNVWSNSFQDISLNNKNFKKLVAWEEKSDDHQSNLNVSSRDFLISCKFHSNPSNSCRDISLWTPDNKPHGGAGGKVKGSPKLVEFILWGPWMFVQNFSQIQPIAVEIFQSAVDRQADRHRHPCRAIIIMAKNPGNKAECSQ